MSAPSDNNALVFSYFNQLRQQGVSGEELTKKVSDFEEFLQRNVPGASSLVSLFISDLVYFPASTAKEIPPPPSPTVSSHPLPLRLPSVEPETTTIQALRTFVSRSFLNVAA